MVISQEMISSLITMVQVPADDPSNKPIVWLLTEVNSADGLVGAFKTANDGHTVTCVWMNNRWYAIDCTVFTKYTNWEEVPDPDKYDVGEWRYPMSRYYGYFDNRMTQIDKCIWEPKNNGTGK